MTRGGPKRGRSSSGRNRSGGVPSRSRTIVRRLGEPTAIEVAADPGGRPVRVAGRPVESVRESWVVEDRWWTPAPIRRRYWEVVTVDGALVTVFREPGGRWLAHR